MAYATSNSPYLISGGLAGAQASTVGGSTAATGYANAMGGGNLWGYRSSDAVSTVVGSSYFSDGYKVGMRLGDAVLVIDTGSTTIPLVTLAAVTAVTTSGGGVSVTRTSSGA